jgi:catalase
MLSHFYKADTDFGMRITKAVNGNINIVKQLATQL